MKEVGTIYWIKAYFWSRESKKFIAVLSEPTDRLAVFQPQDISYLLWQSRKLRRGTRFEDDPSNDLDIFVEPQQANEATSLPGLSQLADRISTHELLNPAASGFETSSRKRTASAETAQEPLRKVSRSPLNARPAQRQSTESTGEYSLGAQRDDGGKSE